MIIDDDLQSAWFETGVNGATGLSITDVMALHRKDNEENDAKRPY